MRHSFLIGLFVVIGLILGCGTHNVVAPQTDQSSPVRTLAGSTSDSYWYLHGSGGYHNPSTLFLDLTSPSSGQITYQDSTGVHFSGGNPWAEVGTWQTDATKPNSLVTNLSDLHIWAGLKTSDDQGTHFDVRIEVWKDYDSGSLVGWGETYDIIGLTRNPALAKEIVAPFTDVTETRFDSSTDTLSLRILVRIGTDGNGNFAGGHSSATGIRTYFDDSIGHPAAFTIIGNQPSNYGWAKTWGGGLGDGSSNVIVDSLGNVYVTGNFQQTIDLDPGPGMENRTSNGSYDAFLNKFGPTGIFLWTKTWGGDSQDGISGVAIDGSGNIYVIGSFQGTVDLDPGVDVDNHTSNGHYYIFLSKFDSSGEYLWARTWGSDIWDISSSGIIVDGSDNVYVTGSFRGTVDFDPSTGVNNHTSNYWNAFLSKFDPSGGFLWVRTWGEGGMTLSYGITIDGSDNIYVTGELDEGDIDFDPGTGVDNHTSNGSWDAFLSKLDSSGNFQWAKTWGGSWVDSSRSTAVDGSGNIYATGSFQSPVIDLDPGSGVENRTSNGSYDAFLSKFEPTGTFLWARTWGGSDTESITDVAVDESGNIYVIGSFLQQTVDFDPGDNIDYHGCNGLNDVFVSKFSPAGIFLWANTWGGPEWDFGGDIVVDASDNIYAVGVFWQTVDFDPGPGEDNRISNGDYDVFLTKFLPD